MTTEQPNDLHYETEQPQPQPSSQKFVPALLSTGVVLALTAIIVCSYLLFNLFRDSLDPLEPVQPQQQEALATETNEQIATQIAPPTAEAAPAQTAAPLPELNDSDEEVRSAAISLNPSEQWAGWVTTDEALRKFVVVIDNLAQGKIARKHLPMPKPEQKFKTSKDGINFYLDPASFERYAPYVRLVKNIDTEMTVKIYQHYSPLLEEAFAELGYPDQTFHATLLKAFDVLLDAPVINTPIELIRPSVHYKFIDPTLEKSPAAHKQLIRMGPTNTQELQLKIRQLKMALSKAAGPLTNDPDVNKI